MKIGVFGDSFADPGTCQSRSIAWWRYLQDKHGHVVNCHGQPGSSIAYSASLILANYQAYDVNIWCLTSPNRFSVKMHTGEYFHSAMFVSHEGKILPGRLPDELKDISEACKNYYKYLSDWQTDNLIGRSVAHYIQQQVSNLIIIPCFRTPLEANFNLYQVSGLEMDCVLPGQSPTHILRMYDDTRSCHLTNANNELLADMLHADLAPRIFTASYQDFSFNKLTIKKAFKPKSIFSNDF